MMYIFPFDEASPYWRKDDRENEAFLEAQIKYLKSRFAFLKQLTLAEVTETFGIETDWKYLLEGWIEKFGERPDITFEKVEGQWQIRCRANRIDYHL